MPGTQSRTSGKVVHPEAMPEQETGDTPVDRKWYAIFTVPRNEQSVARHFEVRQIETFLPTCTSLRLWKNRQRVKIVQPLFPTYIFAKIARTERSLVLGSPGVLRIVGNAKEPLPIAGSDIDFLRSDFCRERIEPYQELVVGQRVRVKCGPIQGVKGVLIRKKSSLKFVLTLELINQHAAVEVLADDLEPDED